MAGRVYGAFLLIGNTKEVAFLSILVYIVASVVYRQK